MNNVVFIGPLTKLERLLINKVLDKISTTALTASNKYSIMTSVLQECRMDAEARKLLKLTIDSFNGYMISSNIPSIIPKIITRVVDSLLNEMVGPQQQDSVEG